MRYKLGNGKEVNIPEEEINANIKGLDVDREEAIQIWLEDNEYEINEEQNKLNEKAKAVKIKHEAKAETKKERKPVERKPDEAKEAIIAELARCVAGIDGAAAVKIVNVGKLITFELDGATYKIDLIRQRAPKK